MRRLSLFSGSKRLRVQRVRRTRQCPLWVIRVALTVRRTLPVFLYEQTSTAPVGNVSKVPIAVMERTSRDVSKVPTHDINSFNHFIGAQGEVRRNLNADFLCGFQIYDEFELARLFDWDFARSCPAQYFDELATQQAKQLG
jgi:hypothetical protein